MNCRKCKKAAPDGAVFCPNCGKRLSTPERRPKHSHNGSGCAFKRGSTWTAQIIVGYRSLPEDLLDPSNSKQRVPIKKTKSGFPTKAAALAYIPTLKNEPVLSTLTLKQVYDAWEPWYAPRVTSTTLGCYRAAFAHFRPLHNKRIVSITAGQLQECMDACTLGHRTHQNMKVAARLLWAYAYDRDIVQKDVTEHLFIGRGASVQREPLTDLEVELIRQQIGKDKYAAYVYALCYLGYRPGEMLEIKKDQVHEQNGIMYIIEGKKTDAGRDRIVPIHKKIEAIIRAQLRTEGTEYLFPMIQETRKGEFKGYKQMTSAYFNDFAFRPLADRLGIPSTKVPYSARHTFSDKLKNAAGTDKTKAALIGHTDYNFTQKKYQTTDLDELRKTMESIV